MRRARWSTPSRKLGVERPRPSPHRHPALAGWERRQTPPFSFGHLVAQEGLFMSPGPTSPSPALRPPPGWPRFRGRGKPGQPPFLPLPFLPSASVDAGRAGPFSRPVESVGGHSLFWEWETGGGVTLLNSALWKGLRATCPRKGNRKGNCFIFG